MHKDDSILVAGIPDLTDVAAATAWFEEKRAALLALERGPEIEASFRPVAVERLLGEPAPPFGRYGDMAWRKLLLATLLSDWSCYEARADQVGIERLFQVMHVFPAGFRVWWVDVPGAGWLPVGYTGWYPIAESAFGALASPTADLRDRNVAALPALDPGGSFVYLFNYSIVAPLQQTACSRRLLRALAADLEVIPILGLAAITVSDAGSRVAERFGMQRSGTLVLDGAPEYVYTRRVS
jgi:hypothetical protein